MEDNQPTSPPGPPSSPPPASPPPPSEPPPASPAPPSNASSNRSIMVILSYLGLLALIPLLVEKDDAEVQWHAKHGLILVATWFVLWIGLMILSMVPGLGLILGCGIMPLVWLAALIVHIMCIVKGLNNERFKLPVVSDFADQWK